MINLNRAKKTDRIMKALTGMTIKEFEGLAITYGLVLLKYQATRKPKRQRAVGGGRHHTLTTPEERLFFVLFYVKCYPTLDLGGVFFEVDKSRIQRWVKELLPLLEEALGREVVLPLEKSTVLKSLWLSFQRSKIYLWMPPNAPCGALWPLNNNISIILVAKDVIPRKVW